MNRKLLAKKNPHPMNEIIKVIPFLFLCFILISTSLVQAASPPYPPSEVISDITWHLDTLVSEARGSDLWPNTWAFDDNIYVAWGDGTGFGNGGNGLGTSDRVALGIARIEGGPRNYKAYNVNGGQNSENPSSFPCEGKVCKKKTGGILSVDGTIYAWINMQDDKWPSADMKLAWSEDLAATWKLSSWSFPKGEGNLKPQTFLNFGRDYAGARDGYVYFYGFNQGEIRNSYMGRVLKVDIKDKCKYEYFAGLNVNDDPIWSSDINQRRPYFTDPNSKGASIGDSHVVYNAQINRYILTGHRGKGGELGIFDAPEPWGPWTTVAYYDDWFGAGGGCGLVYGFANKWTSADGLTMWMIFSCHCDCNYHDQFNLIKATLSLASQPTLKIPPT